MSEEILITHGGYTDTAYSSCGNAFCTLAILRAVGVPERIVESQGIDLNDTPIGEETRATVGRLGERDTDEWCAACGDFIRHGLECGCEDRDSDRVPMVGPHVDLIGHPAMAAFHAVDAG